MPFLQNEKNLAVCEKYFFARESRPCLQKITFEVSSVHLSNVLFALFGERAW